MKLGIESLKDGIEVVSWSVGAISLLIAALGYWLSRNQFRFAVMTSCIDRFQKIMVLLRSANEAERLTAIKQYIDLCNEELFYFKNKYLPKEVVDEWIEGMIYYLPHFVEGENKNISSAYVPEITQHDLLRDYPRIKKAFSVNRRL